MVIINHDISDLVVSKLNIVVYRKLILVNRIFFKNYNSIYKPYLVNKQRFIDNIHSILINLFSYDKLIDAPLISIDNIHGSINNDIFSNSSIILGYDRNIIYIILSSSSKTNYPESLDIIYNYKKNYNIWKYYSNNGIIQQINYPKKQIREGYFLNLDSIFPCMIEYTDYLSIKKLIMD